MLSFLAARAGSLLLTLTAASIVIFALLEVVPGDPARQLLGLNATQDAVDALRSQMGLDAPAWRRYASWIAGMAKGDFGRSLTYSVPVGELIAERIQVSLPLALIALLLSTAIALPVAMFAARRRGKAQDAAIVAASQFGIAIPNFWFALMLVWVFSVTLRLAPAGGFPGWSEGILAALGSLWLPAIALALPQAAILARVARSALIETMNEDFIRTARAKGLSKRDAMIKHALRNAMIPVVTILGLQFAFLLAGTIIVENVFYLPGLGRLVFQAVIQNDMPVVRGSVMLLVASVILINFLVDLAYAWIDPRLRRPAQ